MPLLRPHQYVSTVGALDLEALFDVGVRGLLLDIDNTIMARKSGVVPPTSVEWIARVKAAGFSVCLVSNNWHDYVFTFAEELGVPIAAKAMKPLPFGFLRGARTLGLPVRSCAVVGDQLFTDVLGGNLVGAMTVLVVPVSSSDLPHTLVLRRIERVIMAGRAPVG
jgi:hypothetical protein